MIRLRGGSVRTPCEQAAFEAGVWGVVIALANFAAGIAVTVAIVGSKL